MFENLSERLERSFKILKGQGKITELNVAETLKEVRRSLLDADVNYKIAKDFTNRVKEKALGMNVLTAVKPGQMMVKIVHDELAELMGGKNVEVDIKGNPAIILMSGLQGSGKTTFSGKFANLLKNKKGKKPLLVACDVYRPAAIEQLKVLGEQIQVPVYSDETTKDPVRIALDAIKQAKAKGYDVVIVDTAGRLAIDEQMMNEIAAIKEAIHPNETLFVVEAVTDQDPVDTVGEFNERLDFNGVILTKLDGDTRGGGRSFYPFGSEQTDQVCRNRRETRSFGRLPSRTYGRPYSGDGRYRVPGRKGSGTVRCRRSQKITKENFPQSV